MATWSKLFTNFAWKNRPDTSTPIGQTLLNRLNTALNGIDDRVIALNAQKASTDDVNGLVANISLNEKTGVFTITRFNGTTFTINTALEEVVTNFKYDNSTQQLVLTLADGTTQNVDLSALITQYEFTNSATILWTVTTEGKVVGNIKPNSITDQMLQTNYLADITTQANTAVSASQSALESQSLAEQHAEEADAQADRAKSEADRAEEAAEKAEAVTGITVDTTLDTNSSNPIANKAVAEAFKKVDAKTLDGHGAEYFAPKADLAKYLPLTGGTVGNGSDTAVPLVLTRKNGNYTELGFSGSDGTLGYLGFSSANNPVFENSARNAVYPLLHTGNMADHVLPKTGGMVNGTVRIKGTTNEVGQIVQNDLGIISLLVSANGTMGLWSSSLSKWLISATADGNVAVNGTASGNLPLTGGELTSGSREILTLARTRGNLASLVFKGNGSKMGELGFDGTDRPAFWDSTGTSSKLLLHTGNIADYVSVDSETGTFSLSLSGSVVTSDNLNYCKVGKLVYVYGMVGLNKNVPANSMLTGLPFSIKNGLCVIGGIAQKNGNITTESAMFTNLTYAQGTQISNKSELNAAGPFQLALIYVTD